MKPETRDRIKRGWAFYKHQWNPNNQDFQDHPFIFLWGRITYHINNFHGEISKPLVFVSITLQIATYLAVRGYDFGFSTIVISYIFVGIIGIILGKKMESSGWLGISNSISNKNNPEIMSIKETTEKILQKFNNFLANKENEMALKIDEIAEKIKK